MIHAGAPRVRQVYLLKNVMLRALFGFTQLSIFEMRVSAPFLDFAEKKSKPLIRAAVNWASDTSEILSPFGVCYSLKNGKRRSYLEMAS